MAVDTRPASENARRRSLHYVEHTTERNAVDAGTTPGMEDDCMDAGRLQGCRTTAGMHDDRRDAGARATQERLPRQGNAGAVAEVGQRREQLPR